MKNAWRCWCSVRKDFDFVQTMLAHHLADPKTLEERLGAMAVDARLIQSAIGWLRQQTEARANEDAQREAQGDSSAPPSP